MSFVIKGGYDAIRKQVMNISLKRAEKWTSGIVMIKKNIFLYNLVPRYDNNIEIVKYNDIHSIDEKSLEENENDFADFVPNILLQKKKVII